MKVTKNPIHKTRNIFLSNKNPVYLGLIILLGAVLRFYDLGAESFWIDEIFTIDLISQDLPTLIQQLATDETITRHAVYFLSAHFWALPYKISEISIRSLSVLFGVLSTGMMYLVGRQLFGKKIGLMSSFLMAVSELQIYHSQEARFYSLFVLLTLLSIYFYSCTIKTNKPSYWILHSLINILLFYTHTSAIFIFAAEYIHYFIYFKLHKKTMIPWSLSQLFLFIAVIPSFIQIIGGGELSAKFAGSLAWIPSPSLKDLLSTIYFYIFPQNYQHSWFFIAASFAAGIVFFIFGAFLSNFRKIKNWGVNTNCKWSQTSRIFSQISTECSLVALWFLFPILLPFIYSKIFTPLFITRYTICAAPAFYLLVAAAIKRISRTVPIYITLIALMIVIIPGLKDYYVSGVNEQWREAAAYLQKNTQANDLVIYAPNEGGFQQKSFEWYYPGNISACGFSFRIKDDLTFADALSNCTAGRERFWVIIRGTQEVVDRMKSFFLNLDKTNYRLIKEQQFVQVSVYLFELNK